MYSNINRLCLLFFRNGSALNKTFNKFYKSQTSTILNQTAVNTKYFTFLRFSQEMKRRSSQTVTFDDREYFVLRAAAFGRPIKLTKFLESRKQASQF